LSTPDKVLAGRTSDYRRRRMRAIRVLGGKCSRCGFSDWRALQFDHVVGGGKQDRSMRRRSSLTYPDIVAENKDGEFQLLCANCNWIKKTENAEGCDASLNGLFLRNMALNEDVLVVSFC